MMNNRPIPFRTSRSRSRRAAGGALAAVERVEPRLLFHLEVITPLPDVNATPGGTQAIDLAAAINNEEITGTVVRLTYNVGPIDIELFDVAAPLSAANFLNYVNTDRYNGTIVHRVPNDFVVQGGGYTATGEDITGPGTPTVPNEFSPTRSNLRGTVAYAKIGGQPNSATSEFFINLADNTFLDTQNQGFTVFARVINNGMAVADAIDALPKTDTTVGSNFFEDLPLLTDVPAPTASDLVVLQDASVVPEATYTVTSSDPALVNPTVTGGTVNLAYGTGTGAADVTVTATDPLTGATVQEVFRVTVGTPVIPPVDVVIGDGAQGTVNFTEADGTAASVSLRGGGTATVRFTGTGVAQAVNGRVIDVTGTGVEILSIDTAGTTARSRLTITNTGGAEPFVTVKGINAPAAIGTVSARDAFLTGPATFAGGVGRLDLGRADGAAINIGGTAQDRPATVSVGGLNDTDLTSAAPLRSLTLGTTNDVVAGANTVTAPAIARLTSGAGFTPNLNVGSLGTARVIGGATGAWTVGDARSIAVASTPATWVANFTGAVRSLTATEGLSGNLTAASIGQMRVGTLTGANVTLAQASGLALGRLTAGSIANSNIRTTGDIGTVTANTISNSTIYAGVNVPAGSLLPTAATDFVAPSTIRGVTVRSRTGEGYINSAVAASNLGRINLGTVNTAGQGAVFGVAADTIASLTAAIAGGETLRLRRLTDVNDGGTAGNFDVRVF